MKLEKLRKERLKREEAEKLKSEALLKQHYGLKQASAEPSTSSEEHPRK